MCGLSAKKSTNKGSTFNDKNHHWNILNFNIRVREDGFYTDLTLRPAFITAGEKLDVSHVNQLNRIAFIG